MSLAVDAESTNAYTSRSRTWEELKKLTPEEIVRWRVADVPDRPSADERNLLREFPFGWYGVSLSSELAAGQVVSVRFFGREMALWRGHDGVPRLIDAYCAHYGANLSKGGTVAGNLLECPFHSWRWDGDGSAKEVPYARVIPPQARRKDCIPSYPVQEANGIVWMWYHPERAAPLWDVIIAPEYGDPDWTDYTTMRWNIFTALEHFGDNAVDTAHFRYVHRTATMPEFEFKVDGLDRWGLVRANMGTPKGMVEGSIEILSRGPGQSITRFRGIAEMLMCSVVTPIDRDKMMMIQNCMFPKSQMEGPLAGGARALLREICRQTDQDKLILDQHKRMEPPIFCDGDGPFGRNRAYNDQFLASKRKPLPSQVVSAE